VNSNMYVLRAALFCSMELPTGDVGPLAVFTADGLFLTITNFWGLHT